MTLARGQAQHPLAAAAPSSAVPGACLIKPEATYDIFRKTSDKDATWVESVDGLEHAKNRMRKLASTTPGAYLLYDPRLAEFIEPFAESAQQ